MGQCGEILERWTTTFATLDLELATGGIAQQPQARPAAIGPATMTTHVISTERTITGAGLHTIPESGTTAAPGVQSAGLGTPRWSILTASTVRVAARQKVEPHTPGAIMTTTTTGDTVQTFKTSPPTGRLASLTVLVQNTAITSSGATQRVGAGTTVGTRECLLMTFSQDRMGSKIRPAVK